MKVKVTWRNQNPFCPRWEDLSRISEAEIEDNTSFEQIETWAKEATPQGFWLNIIDMPDKCYTYHINGEVETNTK